MLLVPSSTGGNSYLPPVARQNANIRMNAALRQRPSSSRGEPFRKRFGWVTADNSLRN